jgi:hypothetical protein
MPTDEDLRRALKAFRKRLKLTRLDDESRLGVGPIKTGTRSQIVSIRPPIGFEPAIWEALADKGCLKRDGSGFYELIEGRSV